MKSFGDMWKDHDCEGCEATGHCSVEPIARYFAEHPEREQEAFAKFDEVLMGGWLPTAMVDATTDEDSVELAVALALATGYLIGKGVAIPEMTPSPTRVLQGLVAVLIRNTERREVEQHETTEPS